MKKPYRPKKGKPKSKPTPSPSSSDLKEGIRINRYIAMCGICSRRKAAELVKQELVTVNGEVTTVGYKVVEGDEVMYNNQILKVEARLVYLLMNKPKDTITTVEDDRGRRTVIDLLKDDITERVFPVGRLDRETTGLLLLTNDGTLAQKLAHPSYEIKKVYQVLLDKPISKESINKIKAGLKLGDGIALVDAIDYVDNKKNEVAIALHIGRNRIVRRIFEYLDFEVLKLDRTYYAGLTKKDLGRGRYRFLTEKEVILLKHFT